MFVRRMRPRFTLTVPTSPEAVIERIEQCLERPDSPCNGAIAGNHQVVELSMPRRDRNFWSPTLSVTVAESPGGSGSVVHGLVGPNPDLWTLFAMTYMGLWTLMMFVGIFGLIQWWLDLYAWGLFFVPILVVGLASMVVLSRIGQRLAAPQTAVLREFLEESLDVSKTRPDDSDADARRASGATR